MLKEHYHTLKHHARQQHWIFWQALVLSVITLVAVMSVVIRGL